MNKRIVSVIGGLVVIALLSVMVIGVVSAQEPAQPEVEDGDQPETSATFECPMYQWRQEKGNSGEFVRPWMDPDFECPAGCPLGSNFVDENNDGINDNAPRAGSRWSQDDDTFGRGMMGRGTQKNNFGPGMGMNRWNQDDDTFGHGMMGRGAQKNNFGPGMGMNRWNQDDDTFGRGMGRWNQ